MDTLSDLKKDLGEVKSAMLDMQNRDADRWSRVDTLMSFLQDLRTSYSGPRQGKSTGVPSLRRAMARTRFLNDFLFQVSVSSRFLAAMEGWPMFFL
jgi:hypothetical protein